MIHPLFENGSPLFQPGDGVICIVVLVVSRIVDSGNGWNPELPKELVRVSILRGSMLRAEGGEGTTKRPEGRMEQALRARGTRLAVE